MVLRVGTGSGALEHPLSPLLKPHNRFSVLPSNKSQTDTAQRTHMCAASGHGWQRMEGQAQMGRGRSSASATPHDMRAK
jgi:hypothetical protein